MSLEAPPPPLFVLRTHTSPVVAVFCSRDNERIYSGDAKGLVDITSTRSLRPIARWPAHTDALLGIEELGDRVITYEVSSCPVFANANVRRRAQTGEGQQTPCLGTSSS